MPTLLGHTLRGLGKTASLTALKSAVDFFATIALIHLLKIPEPWGVFGFLFVGVDLFFRLSSVGGHRYLIQRKGLTPDDLRTVMTVEGTLAVVGAGLWWLLAPLILEWRDQGHLIPAAQVMTLWIITERIGQPARAMLEREMRFGRSNGSMLLGTVTLAAVSISLAVAGWGVMAIIVGKVAQSAVTSLFMWVFHGPPPRPGIARRSLGSYLRFGLPLMPADLLQFYCWQAPVVILWLNFDFEVVGLYFIAFRLPNYMLQLQDLVSTVVYPAFTKARDDAHLLAGFRLATKYSAAVALLPFALVLALGQGVSLHLLGPDYLPATAPLVIFTGLAAFRMITVHWYWAYLAKGRTTPLPFLMALTAAGVTVGAVVGLRWDLTGVAWGVTIPTVAVILLAINGFLRRVLRIRYFAALRAPLAVGAVTLAVGLALRHGLGLDVGRPGVFWALVGVMAAAHAGLGLATSLGEMRSLARSLKTP